MEQPTSSLQNIFQPIFLRWLDEGLAPDAAVEGVTPVFAKRLGQPPADFTLEALFHTEWQPDWAWAAIDFNEIFGGQFYFYWPTTWSAFEQNTTTAAVGESGVLQQDIFLVQLHHWQPRIRKRLERQQILAFAYYPLFRPHYHQWLIVLSAEEANVFEISAAFASGEWLVVIESQAATAAELMRQLTALINANPWHGWIQAAKAQQSPHSER